MQDALGPECVQAFTTLTVSAWRVRTRVKHSAQLEHLVTTQLCQLVIIP